MEKIHNRGGKKLSQKLLSVGVSVSLMVAMVPLGGQNFVAEAAAPTIPDTIFIAKDTLSNLKETYPNGLLSTGTASDKEIFINFGTRPADVEYYYGTFDETGKRTVAGNQAMTWRVAGSETIDGKEGLVLYSKEPMISPNSLKYPDNLNHKPDKDGINDSRFQIDQNNKEFTPESSDGYGDSNKKYVYANHWGASNIRTQLQSLVGTYFSIGEQGILEDSTVKTTDTSSGNKVDGEYVDYETKDKLYAARLEASKYNYATNTKITVGEADNLMIDKKHWAGNSWLRSPDPNSPLGALSARVCFYVYCSDVIHNDPAAAAACRINLESVIFTSVASGSSTDGASGGQNFLQIKPNTPMTLRLDGTTPGKPFSDSAGTMSVVGSTLTYSAPANSRLVVLATASDGITYQFTKDISSTATNETLDLTTVPGVTPEQTVTAKAWLEADYEGQLTYATQPQDVSYTAKKIDPSKDDFKFTAPFNLTYDGTPKAATVAPNSPLTITELGNITISYKISEETISETAPSNTGEYKVLVTTVGGTTYNAITDLEVGSFTINPKQINVKAEDKSKVEGEADPELTFKVDPTTSLVSGENLTGSLARDSGESPGTYNINKGTLTNDNNPNYDITFTKGTFTITAKSSPGDSDQGESQTPDAETPETPSTPDTEAPSTDENEHPDWGTKVEFAGKTMYVDAEGKTSVEITGDGIIWLREESGDTYAWYGLDAPSGVFEKGSRFWVHWANKNDNPDEFNRIWNELGEQQRAEIENNNFYIFEVGVSKPDGTEYTTLTDKAKFYVQIGADWDEEDLKAYYVAFFADDENIPVTFIDKQGYPEGSAKFGIMELSHFSPYIIYDKLTDEEKAELNKVVENLSDEQKQQLEQQAAGALEQIKTGDKVTYFTISGLGLIMTLALGLMIKSKLNKRKFE